MQVQAYTLFSLQVHIKYAVADVTKMDLLVIEPLCLSLS